MPKSDVENLIGNHIRLMKCHIAFAIVYLVFCGLVASMSERLTGALALFIAPAVIHLSLAYGSFKKIELSRKISVFVFILFAIGTIPIGPIIAIIWLLPNTTWVAPEPLQP